MNERSTPDRFPTGEDAATAAMNLVGERWTMLILREAYYGVRRYGQFSANLKIPRPTLSDRLNKLIAAGLLTREQYTQGPIRADYEYRLTDAGLDLFPAVLLLMDWGARHLGPEVPPHSPHWVHSDCGALLHPQVTCGECGQAVTARTVRLADDDKD